MKKFIEKKEQQRAQQILEERQELLRQQIWNINQRARTNI